MKTTWSSPIAGELATAAMEADSVSTSFDDVAGRTACGVNSLWHWHTGVAVAAGTARFAAQHFATGAAAFFAQQLGRESCARRVQQQSRADHAGTQSPTAITSDSSC
ncbi:MAG TPA: hypothetical protein VM165_16340 [Planctomycetaceae bacterium]|nr:hypothetical protein [Planctomycetaceae bacterium]